MKRFIQATLGRLGYRLVKVSAAPTSPALQHDDTFAALWQAVKSYTLTSPQRILALREAVRYVVRHDIPGDIVECGVWRGGSMMAAALTLLEENRSFRTIHLFDTFEGMDFPTEKDQRFDDVAADVLLRAASREDPRSYWCVADLQDVQQNMMRTGYPSQHLRYVKGRVEDTLPAAAPAEIAILRLDTDWYESTAHELLHLMPCLSAGGVLIVDDYGHWKGARRAVDEFLHESGLPIFLVPVDDTGRCAVMPLASTELPARNL